MKFEYLKDFKRQKYIFTLIGFTPFTNDMIYPLFQFAFMPINETQIIIWFQLKFYRTLSNCYFFVILF